MRGLGNSFSRPGFGLWSWVFGLRLRLTSKAKSRRPKTSHVVMRIIVRATNWIGDVVMTIPAIKELRRLFPEAHITLHTRENAADIFRDSPLVDEIIFVKSVLEDVRVLRSHKFDLAVIFPNSFESALAIRLAGIKRRFGYDTQHRSILLTDAVDVPDWKDSRHEVYYYFELVGAVAKRLSRMETSDKPSEPEIAVFFLKLT